MMIEAPAFAHVAVPPPPCGAETFTITDLSTGFHVTPRAIRFYEDHAGFIRRGWFRSGAGF